MENENVVVETEIVENFAKDDIGTKSALEVDKSKDAMSEKPWGEVDKAELRKHVISNLLQVMFSSILEKVGKMASKEP